MRVRRRPFHDEYVEGGESAVLIDDRVIVLSALATSILAAIGTNGTELDEVAEILLLEYGAPPAGDDAADQQRRTIAATREALSTLEAQGLVESIG